MFLTCSKLTQICDLHLEPGGHCGEVSELNLSCVFVQ